MYVTLRLVKGKKGLIHYRKTNSRAVLQNATHPKKTWRRTLYLPCKPLLAEERTPRNAHL
jgi:hypothetical protein